MNAPMFSVLLAVSTSVWKGKWKWICSVVSDSLQPHGLLPTRFLCPWDFPGKNTGVGCHFFLQEIFPTQGLNPDLPHCRQMFYHLSQQGRPTSVYDTWNPHCECVLSHFSRVQLFATLSTTAHQAPLSMEFSRQEYWSGSPCPLPGNLPDPGIKLSSPPSPVLAGRVFTPGATWEAQILTKYIEKRIPNPQ